MNVEQVPSGLPLPETPADALGEVVRERVIVEGRTFVLARPTDGDRLLDHPTVRSAFAADEYMPYWVDLWPAARMLAKVILRETWAPGTEALEVGCGLGLPGVVALAAQGLPFTTQTVRAGEPGGRRFKGTLYRITKPAEG